MKHAILSASGASRWLACPGSVRLTRYLPDISSPYAEEGTAAHTLAERALMAGWLVSDLPVDDLHTQEMLDAVQGYVDFVRAQPGRLFVEHRVDFSEYVPGGFGTADAVVIDDDSAVARITDLKYGRGVRVSADGPQLRLYALGVHRDFGWLHNIQSFELTIYQPRMDHVDSITVSTEELLAWGESIRPIAELAMTENAPLVPGEDQCRWCKVKATCAARAEANLKLAREEFGAACPSPDLLTLEQIGTILPRLGELTRWAADVQEYALDRAAAGTDVPGHKLVAGRSVRQWTDQESVKAAFRRLKYKKADYIEERLIGITAAEKLLGGRKAASPILDPLTTKPVGKPVLVPEADKRPALSVATAQSDFTTEAA